MGAALEMSDLAGAVVPALWKLKGNPYLAIVRCLGENGRLRLNLSSSSLELLSPALADGRELAALHRRIPLVPRRPWGFSW